MSLSTGCPFCGAGASRLHIKGPANNERSPDAYSVRCTACGARGPERDLPTDAAEAWESRKWHCIGCDSPDPDIHAGNCPVLDEEEI